MPYSSSWPTGELISSPDWHQRPERRHRVQRHRRHRHPDRRDTARTGGITSEAQFQDLAEALRRIPDHGYDTLAAIFGSPELTGLTPGQIAQIEWYVNTRSITNGVSAPSTGYHAFLIGRKAGGSWFLSDTDAGLVGAFRIELTPVY